jgi:hypothetical protein
MSRRRYHDCEHVVQILLLHLLLHQLQQRQKAVNKEEKYSLLPVLLRVCLVALGLVSIHIPLSDSVKQFLR